MGKLTDALLGTVEVEVRGRHPERFINLCAGADAAFWGLTFPEPGVARGRMYLAGYKKLAERGVEQAGLELRRLGLFGAPAAAKKVRRRLVFLLALMLCAAGVFLLSRSVWRIEVTGNETVSDTEILRALEEAGLTVGTRTADVDAYRLRNLVLARRDDLIWLTVNTRGSTARVEVAERRAKPEIEDVSVPTRVVAAKDTLVTKMSVLSGAAAAEAGQTVARGETLIESLLTTPRGSSYPVHAAGEVWGRTWYTLRAALPLQCAEKVYTGRETTQTTLLLGRKGLKLFGNSGIPFAECDKITWIGRWDIFGLMALPVSTMTETFREYELRESAVPRAEAEEILRRGLETELLSQLDRGRVLASSVEFREQDGVLTATLYAQCLEQVGMQVPAA